MPAPRVKIVRLSFTTQSTVLVELPDIPGVVVEVSRVLWMVESFSTATAVGVRLYHDIDMSRTLAFASIPPNLWASFSQGINVEGPAPIVIAFTPPYQLIGVQRLDFISSAGSVIGLLTIHYTVRKESNRTLWNELRARTSFERD